ncbi:MAG: RluA family pseudouridine synthase [Candidatus Levyibacteriota bacterium]
MLSIIYENESMFAVDKPAGMIVNNADTAKDVQTLQDLVEASGKLAHTRPQETEKYMVGGYNKFDEFLSRSGIVHRLDKETSGIILVAKNADTFMELQRQFKSSEVKKTYNALVHGRIEQQEGEIDAPVSRLPWNRMRFGVNPGGREAKTLYKVLDYKQLPSGEGATYVEVYPQTGRTHQIRVHFQHIHHPIFADELYAGRKTGRDDRKVLSRHFLHASRISFLNPGNGQRMELESPLPPELSNLLSSLPSGN